MTVSQIGVMLPDVGVRQVSYQAIMSINRILEKRNDLDFTIFYESLAAPVIPPKCAMMGLLEAYSYPGALIATDINLAAKLLAMPCNRRIFYCYDAAEHTRARYLYTDVLKIYRAPNLELWARSEDHRNLLANNWNRADVNIMENFNLEKVLEIATK
jgi:hypothetical protein